MILLRLIVVVSVLFTYVTYQVSGYPARFYKEFHNAGYPNFRYNPHRMGPHSTGGHYDGFRDHVTWPYYHPSEMEDTYEPICNSNELTGYDDFNFDDMAVDASTVEEIAVHPDPHPDTSQRTDHDRKPSPDKNTVHKTLNVKGEHEEQIKDKQKITSSGENRRNEETYSEKRSKNEDVKHTKTELRQEKDPEKSGGIRPSKKDEGIREESHGNGKERSRSDNDGRKISEKQYNTDEEDRYYKKDSKDIPQKSLHNDNMKVPDKHSTKEKYSDNDNFPDIGRGFPGLDKIDLSDIDDENIDRSWVGRAYDYVNCLLKDADDCNCKLPQNDESSVEGKTSKTNALKDTVHNAFRNGNMGEIYDENVKHVSRSKPEKKSYIPNIFGRKCQNFMSKDTVHVELSPFSCKLQLHCKGGNKIDPKVYVVDKDHHIADFNDLNCSEKYNAIKEAIDECTIVVAYPAKIEIEENNKMQAEIVLLKACINDMVNRCCDQFFKSPRGQAFASYCFRRLSNNIL